eukprot:1138866-Pelagomonas_calceolata.AAC.9
MIAHGLPCVEHGRACPYPCYRANGLRAHTMPPGWAGCAGHMGETRTGHSEVAHLRAAAGFAASDLLL